VNSIRVGIENEKKKTKFSGEGEKERKENLNLFKILYKNKSKFPSELKADV
jgi:hypothetical protein